MTDQTVVQRVGAGITKLRNFVMNTIFLVVMVAVIVLVVGSFGDVRVPENSALVLNPRGAMVEQRSIHDPFDDLWLIGQNLPEANIHELVRAVEHAATDDRIEMIVLDLDELSWSSNTHATYLGTALDGFKATGKQVIAFGNYYSQAQYSIATFADAIYLHPFGQLMFSGFGAYQLYFKNLFDRFDVNVHVFRVGEYKEAIEPFTRSDMSPAAKEANQQLVGGLWQVYADLVVENRDIEAEAFDYYTHAFDDALTAAGGDMARAALEHHLVDELLTPDQARTRIADTVGWDADDHFNGIDYRDYLQAVGREPPKAKNVGLIVARGTIQMGDDQRAAGADGLIRLIRQARADDSVRALVLRVDSPGGSAFASELIRQELELLQLADKPLVISMGNVAASGGYWIASTADKIIAHPSTITGSIGIFAMMPTFEKTLSNFGVHTDGVGTSPLSGTLDPMRGINEPMQRVLQANVENGYRQFINLVARGRNMTLQAVREVAEGRVWLGSTAMKLGLVDELGDLSQAIDAAAELASLTDYGIKSFTTPISTRNLLLQELFDARSRQPQNPLVGSIREVWTQLSGLNDPMHTYSLCEACLGLLQRR
ncbi:MAG: signal peptide peptidase SppA [Gammaproteobacteria bacterium]|nr:signal peptide peptidase SppA [Gammaproteobacteria bacterium]